MNHLESETQMISIEDLRALIDSMLTTDTVAMPISDVASKLTSLRLARSKISPKTSDDLDSFSSSDSQFKMGDRSGEMATSFCGPGVYFFDGKYRIKTSATSGGTEFETRGVDSAGKTTHEYDNISGITTKNQGSELDVNEYLEGTERGSADALNNSIPFDEASASKKKIGGLRKSNLRPSLPSTSSFYRTIVSGMFRSASTDESLPSADSSILGGHDITSLNTEGLTDTADMTQPTTENQNTSSSDSPDIPNKSYASLSKSLEQNTVSESHPNIEVDNQVRPHSPGRPELYPPSLQYNNASYTEESHADLTEKENVYLRAEKFRHFAEQEKCFQTNDDIMSDSDESANYENTIPECTNTSQNGVLPDDDDVPPLWWGSIKDEYDLADIHRSLDCNSNDSSRDKDTRNGINNELNTSRNGHTNEKYISSKSINNINYINGDRTHAPSVGAVDISISSDNKNALESDDDSSECMSTIGDHELKTHRLDVSSSTAGGAMKSHAAKVGDTYVHTDPEPDFGSDFGLGSMNSVYGNRRNSYTSSFNPRGRRGGESVCEESNQTDKTHASIFGDVSDFDSDNRFDNSFARTMKETAKMLEKEEDEDPYHNTREEIEDQLEVEVELAELSFVRESPAKKNGRAAEYDSKSLNIDTAMSANTIYGKSHNSQFRNCGTTSSHGDRSGKAILFLCIISVVLLQSLTYMNLLSSFYFYFACYIFFTAFIVLFLLTLSLIFSAGSPSISTVTSPARKTLDKEMPIKNGSAKKSYRGINLLDVTGDDSDEEEYLSCEDGDGENGKKSKKDVDNGNDSEGEKVTEKEVEEYDKFAIDEDLVCEYLKPYQSPSQTRQKTHTTSTTENVLPQRPFKRNTNQTARVEPGPETTTDSTSQKSEKINPNHSKKERRSSYGAFKSFNISAAFNGIFHDRSTTDLRATHCVDLETGQKNAKESEDITPNTAHDHIPNPKKNKLTKEGSAIFSERKDLASPRGSFSAEKKDLPSPRGTISRANIIPNTSLSEKVTKVEREKRRERAIEREKYKAKEKELELKSKEKEKLKEKSDKISGKEKCLKENEGLSSDKINSSVKNTEKEKELNGLAAKSRSALEESRDRRNTQAESFRKEGSEYYVLEEYTGALNSFEKCLKLGSSKWSNRATVLGNRAACLMMLGR